jgi:uncharacterized protein (DUF58 family)
VILPTRRTVALLALLAGLGLIGFATRSALDLLVAADAIVLLLVVADGLLAVPPARVGLERDAPGTFSVGRPTAIGYRWRNPLRRSARLLVREVRPDILGGVQPERAVALGPRQTWGEHVAVGAVRRGREEAGWFAVRSVGPLRLGLRTGRVGLPWSVRVYPNLPATRLKASIAEAVRRRESGLRAIRYLGEGRQFESLREWVPGDDTRRIDWKATARRRKVIARQYEEERRQQVLLVLDAGRLLAEEIDGEARFEHAVRAALLLALAAVYHDDNVGIMVFGREVARYVAPQRGRRGLRQVLDVLAEARPALVESDYPAAFRHLAVLNRKRALTVVFTDAIDRLASEALIANVGSLHPRHLPLVVTLRNPVLDTVAGLRPDLAADAYRKAAAEELLHARAEALAGMRRAGAMVLDVEPHRASAAVVEQYLELKRRGRL